MNRLCMGCMKEYDDRFEVCPYCGYAFDTPAEQSYHIPPGTVLENKYIVGKVLGFGGFGITYVGWDYLMQRKVAIKEYLPGEFATRMPTQIPVTIYSGEKEEQYKEGLAKTIEEARRLARFESVPGIVQIYDCFEANNTSYIIMEFLEGMTLKDYLKQHGRMSPEQAIHVTKQIASAMESVHREGILHRDIAPDNIYVLNPDEPDDLRVKLLDFGAARYATTKHSKSLSVIIKPGYAPEEQYRSRGDQGTWTDVYALAATLYKMLTEVTPEDAMERSVKDELKKPSKMGVKLSKPTETALMNALHIKTQDRTQTMEDFLTELSAAEVKERAVTKDKTDVGRIPIWIPILSGVVILAVAAGIVLMATGIIRFHMNTSTAHMEENMVRMPNVVNEDADEAETILADENLGMSRDRMEFSEEIPENLISYQEVPANSVVAQGTEVVVYISKGQEKGVIPSVTGLMREEALKALEEAGFQNVVIEESMEAGLYDSVLEISQVQGANVALSEEITITVCVNEENQEGDASIQVETPDLSVLSREEAEAALEEIGLKANWVEEYSDEPEGTILAQDPGAGEMVNKDTYVTVRISVGQEKIYMTSVQLMSLEEATAEIESLGLTVGSVTREYSDSVAEGSVISQSVANGEEVKKGDSVNLVVSRGKDPAKQTQAAQQETAAPTTAAPVTTAAPQTTAAPETTTAAPETAPPETAAPETTAGDAMQGLFDGIDW
ncbi:MAG: PASTA domain-containing protein [Clostridiales bacterium]|nr:PASTA domain-containing protein [Clostridiales bacterium]